MTFTTHLSTELRELLRQAVIKKRITAIPSVGALAVGYPGEAGTASAQPNYQGGWSPWRHMKGLRIRTALGCAMAGGLMAFGALAAAPSHAEGCGGGGGAFGGGGYCDSDYWPDGSYMHCVTVHVLGFGGTQCNRVYPPPPPPPAEGQ